MPGLQINYHLNPADITETFPGSQKLPRFIQITESQQRKASCFLLSPPALEPTTYCCNLSTTHMAVCSPRPVRFVWPMTRTTARPCCSGTTTQWLSYRGYTSVTTANPVETFLPFLQVLVESLFEALDCALLTLPMHNCT